MIKLTELNISQNSRAITKANLSKKTESMYNKETHEFKINNDSHSTTDYQL